ncbi:MAG: type VI secretion system contractile sheath small subunit [Pseudomonadota bacterium]|nr:type VI secretion system contractile sheath small subunit [Pseudomonadota bacterium]
MSKDRSIAPKERINITYTPASGGGKEEVELPLKMMVLGDFVGRPDERPVEERAPVNINQSNFNDVMREMDLSFNTTVPNTLVDDEDAHLDVNLRFEGIRDFGPEEVARQVPELRKLLELREALVALKGPLGNVPAFRKMIQSILEDDDARQRLLDELGVAKHESE